MDKRSLIWAPIDKKFISIVEKYPVVYKPTYNPRSRENAKATLKAWQAIAEEMKLNGHTMFSARSCSAKFRRLQHCYETCIEDCKVQKYLLSTKYLDGTLDFLKPYVNKKNSKLDKKQNSKDHKSKKNNSIASFEFPAISLLSSDSDSESTTITHSKEERTKKNCKHLEMPATKTIVSLDMIEALLKSRRASSNAGTIGLMADAVSPVVPQNNVDATIHLSKTFLPTVEPGNIDKHSVAGANNFVVMQNPASTHFSASFPNAQWSEGNVEDVYNPTETRTSGSIVSLDMVSALLNSNNDSSKKGTVGVQAEAGGPILDSNNRSIKYATSHLSETLPLVEEPTKVYKPTAAKANMSPNASTPIMMPLHSNTITSSHVNVTICNHSNFTKEDIESKIDHAKINKSLEANTSIMMPLHSNTITSSHVNATISNHTNFTKEEINSMVDPVKANMSPKIDPTHNESNESKGVSVKKEITSLFDINSDGDDIAVFLNEVADYVSNSYSLEKQRNIRSKICELVFAAEIQEIDQQ